MSESNEEHLGNGSSSLADGQARNAAEIVGGNLRRLRKARGYSLDRLGELSGVSRAMLGQIETSKSVPTISLLWKIADALAVPISSLVTREDRASSVVLRRAETAVYCSQDGRCVRRALVERRLPNDAELFEITLQAETTEVFKQKALAGSLILYVVLGSFRIAVGDDDAADLTHGDSIMFEGGASFSLTNASDAEAVALLVRLPGLFEA